MPPEDSGRASTESLKVLAARRGVDEAVADARFGEQVARPRRIGLQLPPELRNVHVEDVRRVRVAGPPDLLQDHPVREQLALVPGEIAEQVELVRGQVNRLAGDPDLVRLEVDLELAQGDQRLPGWAGTPEDGAETRQQLVDSDRLRDVVVGPRVECRDLLVLVADGREDDQRRRAPSAQLPGDVGSGAVR